MKIWIFSFILAIIVIVSLILVNVLPNNTQPIKLELEYKCAPSGFINKLNICYKDTKVSKIVFFCNDFEQKTIDFNNNKDSTFDEQVEFLENSGFNNVTIRVKDNILVSFYIGLNKKEVNDRIYICPNQYVFSGIIRNDNLDNFSIVCNFKNSI